MIIRSPELQQAIAEMPPRLAERMEKYRAVGEQMQQIVIRVKSPDGKIKVAVDMSGMLVDLRLPEFPQGTDGSRVARQILRLVELAKQKIPDRVAEVMTELVPEDSESIERMVADVRSRLAASADRSALWVARKERATHG
jgi:hypothetical protein